VDENDHKPGEGRDAPVPFVFPAWIDAALKSLPILLGLGATGAVLGIWYWASPRNVEMGYEPVQPVPYSHKLHAGDLGMDCRYCHTTVEKSPYAAVPPVETCMNCHTVVKYDSPNIAPVRHSYQTGEPLAWVQVHRLPDFAFFDHSRHVNKGVGCVECHGRVDQEERVRVMQPLSMGWCLDCHRNPAPHLRPKDQVTNMLWTPPPGEDPAVFGAKLAEQYHVNPPVGSCSGCHR
jgi:hypothetical protein